LFKKEKLLNDWYMLKAKKYFENIINQYTQIDYILKHLKM